MTESLLAHTALGDLQGISNAGIVQFRAVPYAAPPVGDLRFAAPQAVSSWQGVRDATRHGPISPQLPSRLRNVTGDFVSPQSEDCLTLTISTPAIDKQARPVLVWLHGGAYTSGAGSLDWYDGTELARAGNMVVVGVNYRTGASGFLYYPEISNGQSGILDMIAALHWVQEHISAFGGDPKQVCVMGQSAGAHAIMYILALQETRHLFQRAILQSAPEGLAPLAEADARVIGEQWLDILQIERGQPAEIAARLRAEKPERILEATAQLARMNGRLGQFTPPFMPVFDALSTPEKFIAAAAAGARAAGVEVIIGTTREEAHAFLGDPTGQPPDPALIATRFSELGGNAETLEQYSRRRPGARMIELLSDLLTERVFRRPSQQLAEALAQSGLNTWVYQFDWAPAGSPFKACHCLELPFVFGTPGAWSNAPMLHGTDPAIFTDLSKALQSAWIGFIRSGDPSTYIPWPRYQSASKSILSFAPVIEAHGIVNSL
ncbi:carboxylesterase/lipase family protein [Ktedonosporobacter rubrisoli]|nr:carboxylesterase family protein [Ktedonosporobacter rubrisoli]